MLHRPVNTWVTMNGGCTCSPQMSMVATSSSDRFRSPCSASVAMPASHVPAAGSLPSAAVSVPV